ncbi:MAG: bifunctional ornithine acetyltransferase/N-acetylglutamate synthase [Caldilineaceae bacterium]
MRFRPLPVKYDRQLLAFNPESIHAVVINAGNANACTGPQGDAAARLTAEALGRPSVRTSIPPLS